MPRFTARETQLIRQALRIACEDGSIYPTGDDYADDIKLRDAVRLEIDEIEHKLSAAWNRSPT